MHFGGVRFYELRLRGANHFVGECEVSLVLRLFRTFPRFDHLVSNLASGTVPLPPPCFGFDEVADGLVRLEELELARDRNGGVRAAGIDFVHGLLGFRRQRDRAGEGGASL
jgi:hypothetical protein